MDLRKVKKLIELLEESTLSEMEITEGDDMIRLSRIDPSSTVTPIPVSHNTVATDIPVPAQMVLTSQERTTVSSASNTTKRIFSPIVGTFYDAASSDSPPFVSVGVKIKEGDVVCIIEAMKTFNEVKSTVSGRIIEVLKSSGDAVEYDESLFVVE